MIFQFNPRIIEPHKGVQIDIHIFRSEVILKVINHELQQYF